MIRELVIFDTTYFPRSKWTCVNDDVMGGVSQSEVRLDAKHQLHWHGNVSLDNNGGFASVRHKLTALDASSYTGISLLLKGDGQCYKLNLANDLSSGSPRFQARFDTQKDLQLVFIPFQQLSPSVRGRKVDASFNPSLIKMVGFIIADRQKGPFHLLVKRITTYV